MPAHNRMRRSEDFQRAVKSGARAASAHLVMYQVPQTPLSDSVTKPATCKSARVGFIVSKQVGNAVVRNRLERQLRAAALLHMPLTEPVDIVIRAKPSAAGLSFSDLESDLASCTRRMNQKALL